MFIGFSGGIGFGVGWRDSHASSVFLCYNTPKNVTTQTLYESLISTYNEYYTTFAKDDKNE